LSKPHTPALRSVWLLQDGEPLPIDESPRLMRTGDLAQRLLAAGYSVTWWTSRFNHNLKCFREHPGTFCELSPGFSIVLLDGPSYRRNMSWQRIRHYRALAAHFSELAATRGPPDLIVGSYPSPELCDAGRRYARAHGVPFLLDIRDPWPDIFADYLPAGLRWSIWPVLHYYRRIMRRVAADADSIVGVSSAMLDWGIEYSGRRALPRDRVLYIGFRRPDKPRAVDLPTAFTQQEPLVCLFATTCGKSYDGELVADAARLLEAQGERRIRFVVTGDGDMRPQWLARAQGLSNVQFTGWISHQALLEHFRAAHVGLVLLKGGIARFWLGNKIFEYLSASLAIVSDVPGEAAELLDTRQVGVSIAADPAALAATLVRLAGAPELVRTYMHNAHAAFEREFDREVVQAQYLEHLEQLMRRLPTTGAAA
jgi:glycosyltransferase involved in cell wall biosynthesis